MQYQRAFFVLTVLCIGFFGIPQGAQAALPSVVLNELLWMGSSVSSADEWVELRNTTDVPIDLSGWVLKKLSGGTESVMLTIPSGMIQPHGHFVIANDPADTSRLAVQPDLVNAAMSLVNSKLQISLYDAVGLLVDRADDGTGNPLAGSYASGSVWKSMERNPSGADGTVKESWHTASSSLNFDDTLKEWGTPGAENSNLPPVIVLAAIDQAPPNEDVQFDASETIDPENDSLTFLWDFGDGVIASGVTTTHRFAAPGTFSVRLTVSDGRIESAFTTAITVAEPAAPAPPAPDEPDSSMPPSPTSSPVASSSTCSGIRLSEVLPNPKGSDSAGEFVELVNTGDEEADCAGWRVADTASSYTLDADDGSTLVPSRGYLVLPRSRTGISLNNSGAETVTMTSPDGTMVDRVTYEGPAAEGSSYSLSVDGWGWTTTLTAGSENVQMSEVAGITEAGSAEQTQFQTNPHVVINELFPDPPGIDAEGEFVELLNAGRATVNLAGWSIAKGNTTHRIERDLVLEAGEMVALLYANTRLTLNNTKPESLLLVDPFGTIISGVRYRKARSGQSFARKGNGSWVWTTPTPNETNTFVPPSTPAASDAPKTSRVRNAVSVPLHRIAALSRRTKVRVRGTVTASPGTVGSTMLYIQDDSAGMQINASSVALPDVTEGDTVVVEGTVGSLAGEPRINVADEEAVQVVGSAELPAPAPATQESAPGTLVTVEGEITQKRGTTVTLASRDGNHAVRLPAPDGEEPIRVAKGQHVAVTGILRATRTGRRIDTRSAEDVTVRAAQPAAVPSSNVTNVPEQNTVPTRTSLLALLPVIGVGIGWMWWRHRRGVAS